MLNYGFKDALAVKKKFSYSYFCAPGGLKIQWSNGSTDVAGATGRIILTLLLIHVRTTSLLFVSYEFLLFN
jgi:hypothetical protein